MKKNRLDERIPVPETLKTALCAVRLRKMSRALGIGEKKLDSLARGRTQNIKRKELFMIKEYLEEEVSTFVWDCESYR